MIYGSSAASGSAQDRQAARAALLCPPECVPCSFAGASTLRQRMLNFVQNIQYYVMFEVMEPTWHVLEKNLKSASNIDDVLGCHTGFLDPCLKDCMLPDPELLKVVSKLMSVCIMFTNCMQHLVEHADAAQLVSGFQAAINNFSAHLLDLLARPSTYSTSDCEHGMASVTSSLNINGTIDGAHFASQDAAFLIGAARTGWVSPWIC
ncbi:gamma-tubulin complex component 2-like isoform X2 [Aotus nancymaae]|uniref:gamma-tubulin complex component 2-like isoform X2 n=1 Tax=Aotus nancymaae TaxID=37293 RepID=UPI0030FF095E